SEAVNRPANAAVLATRIEAFIKPPPPLATITTVISSPNPAAHGKPVTFTATVKVVPPATGLPTANMTFRDGPADLAPVPLREDGTATLAAAALGAGEHAITVRYGGASGFLESTSPALHLSVRPRDGTKPGVIDSIAEFLLGASEKEPLT